MEEEEGLTHMGRSLADDGFKLVASYPFHGLLGDCTGRMYGSDRIETVKFGNDCLCSVGAERPRRSQ